MKAKNHELKKQLAHCPVGDDKEVVLYEIAVTPQYQDNLVKLSTEYVTWFKNSKGLYWGNYFLNKRDATKDFANRILEEMDRQKEDAGHQR